MLAGRRSSITGIEARSNYSNYGRLFFRPPSPMGPGHMGARRDPSTPSISCLPRDSLHTSNSAAIDSALKELKTTSRRLKTIISFFHDELNILERLYYKGKNQHRSALFWKRVVELKRFAERLNGMNVSNTLEQMRCSFFGITSTTK